MKPLTADVHKALAAWVKDGGTLIVVDDDSDPFNEVTEWWNSDGMTFRTPRAHLFQLLGLRDVEFDGSSASRKVGRGSVLWLKQNPVSITADPDNERVIVEKIRAHLDVPAQSGKRQITWFYGGENS